MRRSVLAPVFGVFVLAALLVASAPIANAQAPAPKAMGKVQITEPATALATAIDPCDPCAKKCKPTCPPCIVFKGCPAPCATEKVVTVTKQCGCTVQVTVKVPPGCEKVKVEKDGDARYEYGKYGVHFDWREHGSKLIVRYHS